MSVTALVQRADPAVNLATFTLDDLAQFKREKAFRAGSDPHYRLFMVGRDDVHGVLAYLLARVSRSLRMNMFGYDDDALDQLIRDHVADPHVYAQITLDKSQAGGVHERAILAKWDAAALAQSVVIGQSATHQISHTKGGVIDGWVWFEGSTNWSASGEGTIVDPAGSDKGRKAQNNTLVVSTDPVAAAEFTDELDIEHTAALHKGLGLTGTMLPAPR